MASKPPISSKVERLRSITAPRANFKPSTKRATKTELTKSQTERASKRAPGVEKRLTI